MVNILPIETGLDEAPYAYRSRENIPQGIFLQQCGNGFRIDHFHSNPDVVRGFVCEIRSEAQVLANSTEPTPPAQQ